VVELVPWTQPPVAVSNHARFAEVVKRAFAQRRKTIRNSLSGLLPESAIAAAGIDPAARAERLSVADFARLSEPGAL
jgi:16S rRNA (adenine1518-N6/adenine1519-N6)-dimethyltransferase